MRWWDIEAVMPLEQELFAADPPWTAEQFWSELAGVPETRWYVVADDGSASGVAGYAGLVLPGAPGDPADIHTIAVAPERQRSGVGSMLMRGLVATATEHGAGEVLLEVRADNDPALAFYARHGFERIAVRRRYYGGGRDGYVLRRRLAARSEQRR